MQQCCVCLGLGLVPRVPSSKTWKTTIYWTPLCLLSPSFFFFLLSALLLDVCFRNCFSYPRRPVLHPASCLVSHSSLSLLFPYCFFFAFPCPIPYFNHFSWATSFTLTFWFPLLNHSNFHLLPHSVLQPPAHMSSSLSPDPELVSPVLYFSHTADPSLMIPLIDVMPTWHSGDIRTDAIDVLGPF